MYCNQCGSPLAAGVTFCSNCGRAVGATGTAVATPVAQANGAMGRVTRHRTILGVLWLLRAVMTLPGGLVLVGFSGMGHWPVYGMWGSGGMPPFLAPMMATIGAGLLALTALSVAVGVGLLMAEGWARILAIVAAVVSLIQIPFGTALGIYTLWVLLPDQSAAEYGQLAQAKARA